MAPEVFPTEFVGAGLEPAPSSKPDHRAYEAVIGLEVHAELATRSKMFCSCPVVDPTQSAPNTAVCPVCAGMPGVLPVVNRQAVEFALRVHQASDAADQANDKQDGWNRRE